MEAHVASFLQRGLRSILGPLGGSGQGRRASGLKIEGSGFRVLGFRVEVLGRKAWDFGGYLHQLFPEQRCSFYPCRFRVQG